MRNHNWRTDQYECGEGNACNIVQFLPLVGAAVGAAGSYLAAKEQGKSAEAAADKNAAAMQPKFYGPGAQYGPGILSDAQNIYNRQGFAPDPNDLQLLGRENTLGYAEGALPGMINSAQQSWLGGLNPGMDPYVGSMIQAGQNDLAQNFQRNVLPYLSGQASGAGGFGGGRHQVGEGIAAEGLMEAQGDLATGLLSKAYGQRLGQQRAAWAAAPNMTTLGFMPSQAQQEVGGQYQQDAMNPAANLQGYQGAVNPWVAQSGGMPSPGYQPTPSATMGAIAGGVGGYRIGNWLNNTMGNWNPTPQVNNPVPGDAYMPAAGYQG